MHCANGHKHEIGDCCASEQCMSDATVVTQTNNRQSLKLFSVLHKFYMCCARPTTDNGCNILDRIMHSKEFVTAFKAAHFDAPKDGLFCYSALTHAAYFANNAAIHTLMRNGAKADAEDAAGWTPLLWALVGSNVEGFDSLLAHYGANAEVRTASGLRLVDFLVYGSGSSSNGENSLGKKIDAFLHALKRTKRCKTLAADVAALQRAHAKKSVGRSLVDDHVCIFEREHIRIAQLLVETPANAQLLDDAMYGPMLDDFLVRGADAEDASFGDSFTLPVPAALAVSVARCRHFVEGVGGWAAFVRTAARRFAALSGDGSQSIANRLFWLGTTLQLWHYACTEDAFEWRTKSTLHHEMREIAQEATQRLLRHILERIDEIVPNAILDRATVAEHRTPSDELRSFVPNDSPKTSKPLPNRLVAYVHLVWTLLNLHFSGCTQFIEYLLKIIFTFVNNTCIGRILLHQSKYCSKLNGMNIRLNVAEIEDWLHDRYFAADPEVYASLVECLAPIACFAQYLQIYSCVEADGSDFLTFCHHHNAPNSLIDLITQTGCQKASENSPVSFVSEEFGTLNDAKDDSESKETDDCVPLNSFQTSHNRHLTTDLAAAFDVQKVLLTEFKDKYWIPKKIFYHICAGAD